MCTTRPRTPTPLGAAAVDSRALSALVGGAAVEVAGLAAAEAAVAAEASPSRLEVASRSAVLSVPASSDPRTLAASSADAVAFCFHPK